MLPVLLRLHLFGREIPVYGYGVMLAVALIACVKAGQWLGGRAGIRPELFVNASLLGLLTGLAGARLCDVLENIGGLIHSNVPVGQKLAEIADLRQGGLTFYGGFLLATPCLIFYAWRHRIPILRGMDVVAPVLMIGLGIGRVGCFLNGCCYGERCDAPWAVRFPYFSDAYQRQFAAGELTPPPELLARDSDDRLVLVPPDAAEILQDPGISRIVAESRALPVQPAELYSSFTAFLLAALLIAFSTLPHVDGRVFALMMILEGPARFVLEILRVEAPVTAITIGPHTYGISLSMILGLLVGLAGLAMWWMLAKPAEELVAAC